MTTGSGSHAGAAIGLLLLCAGRAMAADVVIDTQNPRGPDLGKVAQPPAGSSVWRVDPDTGDVSLVRGDAVRLTTGPSMPPTITIACPTTACRNAMVTAAFAPSASGRATILGFTPGGVSSSGLTLQSVSGAGTPHQLMTFLAGSTLPARASFPLGMTVRLSPGADGASPNYGYTLVVTLH